MKAADRDILLGEINERTKTIESDVKEHNGQIRAIEKWQAKMMGSFAVVGVIVVIAQEDVREFVGKVLGG